MNSYLKLFEIWNTLFCVHVHFPWGQWAMSHEHTINVLITFIFLLSFFPNRQTYIHKCISIMCTRVLNNVWIPPFFLQFYESNVRHNWSLIWLMWFIISLAIFEYFFHRSLSLFGSFYLFVLEFALSITIFTYAIVFLVWNVFVCSNGWIDFIACTFYYYCFIRRWKIFTFTLNNWLSQYCCCCCCCEWI